LPPVLEVLVFVRADRAGDATAEGPLTMIGYIAGSSTASGSPMPGAGDYNAEEQARQENVALISLLARMARHDERALADFYDLTIGRVYGLTLRITRRTDAAEDVAAETYLQIWRDASRYEPARGSVLAWVLTICRTRAIDSIRRRDRAQNVSDPEKLSGEQSGSAEDPQDLLLHAERDSALHLALAELSAIQRQLLSLAFFRGMTHEEIAAHAHLPLGSVKTHIRKALAHLRTRLAYGPAGTS
jgi:RNA polymerase sigma-70 factor (ECF subfamily)